MQACCLRRGVKGACRAVQLVRYALLCSYLMRDIACRYCGVSIMSDDVSGVTLDHVCSEC